MTARRHGSFDDQGRGVKVSPHRIAPLIVASLAMTLGACASFQDPKASPDIEEAFPPAPPDAELIQETFLDGKWRGDQPPPAISRGWLVDCADVEADVAGLQQFFLDEGFVEDDQLDNALQYRRPSDGFTAGVDSDDDFDGADSSRNPAGLSRDQVAGRCLVVATVEDTDYSES